MQQRERNPNISLKKTRKPGKKDKNESEKIVRNNHKKNNKMAMNTYLLIITLNVNGLNTLFKRYRVTEYIKKQDPSTSCLQETPFRSKDTGRLNMRG